MFTETLTKLREERNYNKRQLAELLEMPYTTYNNYETGAREPNSDVLKKIASLFGVTIDYLLGIEKSVFDIPGVLPIPKTTKKPRLGVIACGDPILAVENLDGYDDVPENIHCDFTLICKGDSMIGARIHDGDVVYIRQQEEVENHEIAAVIIDEEAVTLKRVYRDNDHLVLMAENPTFPPIVVNGQHTARIIGKAVGFTSIIK
jgi:repressor LexA